MRPNSRYKSFNLAYRLRGCLLVLLLACPLAGYAADVAPLTMSGPQVVDELMRHNAERAAQLNRYTSCRYYSIRYSGLPVDKAADMLVSVEFQAPSSRQFRVVRENGSHLLISHVLKQLLAHERDSQDQQNSAKTALTTDNYDFQLVGTDTLNGRPQYVLAVRPRTRYKYLYRGKLWVDATEFAVTQLAAEPAQNPSFWISHTEIQHVYKKVGEFWLPARNTTTSKIRLGGSAKLEIEYLDYKIGASSGEDACANASKVSRN